jgi:hypothetical protein
MMRLRFRRQRTSATKKGGYAEGEVCNPYNKTKQLDCKIAPQPPPLPEPEPKKLPLLYPKHVTRNKFALLRQYVQDTQRNESTPFVQDLHMAPDADFMGFLGLGFRV